MARRKGALGQALVKRREHTYFEGPKRLNTLTSGPGSSRRGKSARVGYSATRGLFFHDYGGSIGKVYLRHSNPLTAQYRKRYEGQYDPRPVAKLPRGPKPPTPRRRRKSKPVSGYGRGGDSGYTYTRYG